MVTASAGYALPDGAPRVMPRVAWPALRQELAIYEGPRLRDGQPSWTLHDPVRNLYFQLDWLTFEILVHWALGDARAIVDAVGAQTTLQATVEDVGAVQKFLAANHLVDALGMDTSRAMAAVAARSTMSVWKRLLHSYLFFRIPLVQPDALLTRLQSRCGFLYSARFLQLTALAFALGMILVYREWDAFRTTLAESFTYSGAIGYFLTLVSIKILHEFGHGLTAKRHGCRVPTMGIAFLVMWPMPYTDTNEAWKLRSRRQRLQIGAAGVATELIIAVWATLAWAFLPDGALRSAAFLLSTTTWVSTVLVNCSPFMRFDGYFVLSDFLGMPNLHARAFALARWQLREWLFRLDAPPPEHFGKWRRRGLLFFSYFTWCYRLVVFLGIAVLVYKFFIKTVGIFLFGVEIVWFVIMPVYSEMKAWKALWPHIRERGRFRVSFVLAVLALAACFVPLPGRIEASGLLHPGEEFIVYAREGARLEAVYAADGASVKAATPLFKLSTEELDQRLNSVRSRVERYDAEISVSSFSADDRQKLLVHQSELQTAHTTRRGLESQRSEYTPAAPFDGRFRMHDPDLRAGTWVARNEELGTVVKGEGWHVECYVSEEMLNRIAVGNAAHFYPDGRWGDVVALKVSAVDRDATHVLASLHGGSVQAREAEGRLIPEKAAYRVNLEVIVPETKLAAHTWRGNVVILGSAESLAVRFGRAALSTLWREAGW